MIVISRQLSLGRIVLLICILAAMVLLTGCETSSMTPPAQHTHAPRDLDMTY